MTIAKQLKQLFTHHKGNFRAKKDAHIQTYQTDKLIQKGDILSRTIIELGGYWEGDRCLFEDGSFLDFSEMEIKTGEEQ